MRLPPPRSKSPIKTFLQSPARRNPSLGPGSSPVRPAPRATSVSTSVRRKLDFSNASFESIDENTGVEKTLEKRAGSAMPVLSNTKLVNGNGVNSLGTASSDHNNNEVLSDDSMYGGDYGNGDDSLQMVNGESEIMMLPEDEEEEITSEPEDIPEPEPKASKKGKGKAVEEVVAKVSKRGRPKKVAVPEIQEVSEPENEVVEQDERPKKRSRSSIDGPAAETVKTSKTKGRPKKLPEQEEQPIEDVEERPHKSKAGRPKKAILEEEQVSAVEQDDDERPAKRSRLSNEGSAPPKPVGKAKKAAKEAPVKAKPVGRRPKLATIEEAESPAVQRGPPLPRTNNGLFILRRETPSGGTGFKQTRSGRNSIKPVAYWKNERVEYAEDEMADGYRKYLMPRIKEVIRAEEVEQPRKRARAKSRAPKARKDTAEPESEDDDEVEPWEMEPGRIFGAIRAWDPADPTGAEAEELEEEVALSSAAIITRDIAGASFKFAKTLSYPFFGAGMVDLPPGAQKKPKNSRRMQMAFFVLYGRVKVIINDTEFRIGKGGMFQVPRGRPIVYQSSFKC